MTAGLIRTPFGRTFCLNHQQLGGKTFCLNPHRVGGETFCLNAQRLGGGTFCLIVLNRFRRSFL